MSEYPRLNGPPEQLERARKSTANRIHAFASWVESLPIDDKLRDLLPGIDAQFQAVETIRLDLRLLR